MAAIATDPFGFAPAIAVFPLVAFVVTLVFGTYMPKKGAFAGIIATAGSLVVSLVMFAAVTGGETHQTTLYEWTNGAAQSATGVETIAFSFGILIDPLSALMLVIVSLVALLVHVFSLGYMNAEGETGLRRYYAELGLFTFSMLAFVFADNLLMAFMFFELVGLCSYLLIGFWFRTESAPRPRRRRSLSPASVTTSSWSGSSPSRRRSVRSASLAKSRSSLPQKRRSTTARRCSASTPRPG